MEYKDILKRLDNLQQKRIEPVTIWELYRMPDGSEQEMRWTGIDRLDQMCSWQERTGAVHINTIIKVKEGEYY